MPLKYNIPWWGKPPTDLMIELKCFANNWTREQGGLGAYRHFRNAARMLFPKLSWNPWLEWQIETLCDKNIGRVNSVTREVVFTGCGASGKTFSWGLFAFIWWLADPLNSTVFLTSTSAKMGAKRMWAVIEKLYYRALTTQGSCGNLVASQKILQAVKGDDKHAIFVKAVGKGEAAKAAADIQGVHSNRMLVLLDEATEVQPGILTAIENVEKGAIELLVGKVGNAKSRFDPLGDSMTPKDGWESVSVDSEEWETAKGGFCLHFDGYKSPNVKAGRTMYPHIYSWENYLADQKKDQNTITIWMYTRGYPPPDSVSDVVMSEALILMHNGMGVLVFLHSKTPIAALDPAFGGDKCMLVFGEMGELAEGPRRKGVQVTEYVEIETSATIDRPRDYQIADQTIAACKARGVSRNGFGMDATGTGRGVYAIIHELWDDVGEIKKVEFGGAASQKMASKEDPRPGSDVYDRRVTELWYSVRDFVCGNQLAGLNKTAVQQFSMRKIEQNQRKWKIETKEDYRNRTQQGSPDEADGVSILVEVARVLGAESTGAASVRADTKVLQIAMEAHSVYADTDLSDQTLNAEAPQESAFATHRSEADHQLAFNQPSFEPFPEYWPEAQR